MDKITSVTFVTASKHHHCFDRDRAGKILWTCFSANLPVQCGHVIKFLVEPKVGQPLKFACIPLNDNDSEGENNSIEKTFVITTTSEVVDIIH